MSKAFIIPDVHLKPWMFEKANEIISNGYYDVVVMLGDLVDDWNQEFNIDLYNETFDVAIDFVMAFPNTFWCYGNHDVSYVWQLLETGYSSFARETVVRRIDELKSALPPENSGFIHRIDNVLFSHAGLTRSFVEKHFEDQATSIDYMIGRINQMGPEELWKDDSPIWARPQYGGMPIYQTDLLQVVGHTPSGTAELKGQLLTVDNFSTYRDGSPIGDEKFIWVDTFEKDFWFLEK